ncbi:alcohol dehydrogenase catalytic domain-containing protein [Streptomyces sp. NPDC054864]
MAQYVRGGAAPGKGLPVELHTTAVPVPGPGEAAGDVQAGVCQTDYQYRQGGVGDNYPSLPGHEAAGMDEAVGEEGTGDAPGDFVVLNSPAACGDCRAGSRGRQRYCFATRNTKQKFTLELDDGTPLLPDLGTGSFTEIDLVTAGQSPRVDTLDSRASDTVKKIADQHREPGVDMVFDEVIGLDGIEAAFGRMRKGEVLRSSVQL